MRCALPTVSIEARGVCVCVCVARRSRVRYKKRESAFFLNFERRKRSLRICVTREYFFRARVRFSKELKRASFYPKTELRDSREITRRGVQEHREFSRKKLHARAKREL